MPVVGFPAYTVGDDSQEDVTPPPHLMEHPPLAVFVNGEFDICFLLGCYFKTEQNFLTFDTTVAVNFGGHDMKQNC